MNSFQLKLRTQPICSRRTETTDDETGSILVDWRSSTQMLNNNNSYIESSSIKSYPLGGGGGLQSRRTHHDGLMAGGNAISLYDSDSSDDFARVKTRRSSSLFIATGPPLTTKAKSNRLYRTVSARLNSRSYPFISNHFIHCSVVAHKEITLASVIER
jgi:hypothetical protein